MCMVLLLYHNQHVCIVGSLLIETDDDQKIESRVGLGSKLFVPQRSTKFASEF